MLYRIEKDPDSGKGDLNKGGRLGSVGVEASVQVPGS